MNLLTFDTEEWYIEQQNGGRKEKYEEYDRYLDEILDKLDERKLKATFFCIGEMGKKFPSVIRKIQVRGHEIGCHSNLHTWLNKMSEKECGEDTRRAVDSLEQCIGDKVISYRAPAFSIGPNNIWAFEILAENGIERDASVFPAAREFGGFPSFGIKEPCIIENKGIRIKEFPICTVCFGGKEIAYSGGGYFRFFPKTFISREMRKNAYAMMYFHIEDFVPEHLGLMSKQDYEAYFKEKGTIIARWKRYLKSNIGKNGAFSKLMKIIDQNQFVNLAEANGLINWELAPVVEI